MMRHWHHPEPCAEITRERAMAAHATISLRKFLGDNHPDPLPVASVGKHRAEWPGVDGEHGLGFTCGRHLRRVA